MNRKTAIQIVAKLVGNDPIISANGYISRDLFQVCDKTSNFYMIGSMGLSSSIALGVSLKNPKKRVYVLDGDANILMNLGSLTTIGTLQPKNLIHLVFDNSIHESTGGQPTNTRKIQIEKIAKAANYNVFKTNNGKQLSSIIKKTMNVSGPILILIKIKKSDYVSKRVGLKPVKIKERFMKSLIM